VGLAEPEPGDYDSAPRAQFQFNRLLEGARDALDGGVLILALDEFEAVERAVDGNKIGPEIYQFVRARAQEPWLTLVFGGLHTLDEMSRDYVQPFYGSYANIRVSYLSHDAAWQLITNPNDDFELDYEREAVERVITATGGQPYLVQQVCRDALDHVNHELFDMRVEREVKVTLADVEAALGQGDEFFRRGTVYFDGVWTQVGDAALRALLGVMARRDGVWGLDDLAAAFDLDEDNISKKLGWAERHDLLRKVGADPPGWEFCVPLMRQWIGMGKRS